MFLSHDIIEQYIDEGKIIIKPDFDKKNIRPAGIRVHLAKDILVPESDQKIEMGESVDLKYREIDLEKEDYWLESNGFILGATVEAIQTTKDVLMFLDGRSTIARMGLTTHVTASVIDGTFEVPHVAVLEIKNLGNFTIKLKAGVPIAMMLFAELKGEVSQKIQGQYGGHQGKATPPNLKFQTGSDL